MGGSRGGTHDSRQRFIQEGIRMTLTLRTVFKESVGFISSLRIGTEGEAGHEAGGHQPPEWGGSPRGWGRDAIA